MMEPFGIMTLCGFDVTCLFVTSALMASKWPVVWSQASHSLSQDTLGGHYDRSVDISSSLEIDYSYW